jgi:hypothetical protein
MPLASLPQRGPMIGASISVDGIAFDGLPHRGPSEVFYHGPEVFTAVSGRPYLQGPVQWECRWATIVLDDYQALYTAWNLKINSGAGPRVAFGLNDGRNAGAWQTYDCWMSEPPHAVKGLYLRDVVVTFTTVID